MEGFYDLIIKCNSIAGLKNGWEVKMAEKGKKNCKDLKNSQYMKIGVIGNENKGKSTVLSDISKMEIPTGIKIKTGDLSIKYPELSEFRNRKLILFESALKETSIFKDDNISSTEGVQEEENVYDLFRDKCIDLTQIRLFLQNFIIKYSDILILVLGKLKEKEQNLLLKVKSQIKNLYRRKPLIVIHNLKEFETRKQVYDYLENILKKSSTFSLEEIDYINLEDEESEWKPLFEPKSEPKIYHLIYAKKFTEAGNYYNEKAINYIYKIINSTLDKDFFDPIHAIKYYFSEFSESILEAPIKSQDLIYNDMKIMLKEQNKKITFKKYLKNEIGIVQGNSSNDQYSYYITEKIVLLYIKLTKKFSSGKDEIKYEDVKVEMLPEGNYNIIKITGGKKNCLEENIKTKEESQFNVQIKLGEIRLSGNYDFRIKNGCALIALTIMQTQ